MSRTVLVALAVVAAIVLALVAGAVVYTKRSAPETSTSAKQPGSARAEPAEEPGDDRVPHPLFPTAERAGTQRLFYVEEPDRGPPWPSVALPEARTLTWSSHDTCELDHVGLTCSPPSGRPLEASWRVGQGPGVTLAEQRVGKHVHERLLLVRDREGRLRRVVASDSYGEPAWGRSYDPPGRRYAARKRTGANELAGCGYIEVAAEEGGRAAEVVCLQWTLKPMKDAQGVAIRRFARGRQGLVAEERRLGSDRRPLDGHDGAHRVVIARDAAGLPARVASYDTAGKPVVSTRTGCHAIQLALDRRGLPVERRCLGVDGRTAADKNDVAIERYEHDANGCRVMVSHLDPAGRPVANTAGVQTIRIQMNDRCRPLRRTCHDEGRVACGPNEPAEYRFALDGKGRKVKARHFGVDGRPGKDPEYGSFELRYSYDDRGNKTEESCFDRQGQPQECANTGFHRVVSRYDEAGRNIDDRFFDAGGYPTTNLGTFVRRFRYDAYDHLHETRDFDEEGEPVESLGTAARRYLYDEGHRLFGVIQFDAGGGPAAFRGCVTGRTCPKKPWHAVRVIRSAKGTVVRNLFFDRDRRLIHRIDCRRAQCWQ